MTDSNEMHPEEYITESDFVVMTKPGCTYCDQAKALLTQKGYTYREERFETSEDFERFIDLGFRTFPQIYDGPTYIGGFMELRRYLI